MYLSLFLSLCAISEYLPRVAARPGELHVRSLCARSPNGSPHPSSGNPSTTPKLNCNPCHFEFAIVTDNDEKSKSKTKPNLWESKFSKTSMDVKANADDFTITLGTISTTILSSNINSDGKGMELSELIYFNGHLLAFDDKTGTIFRIIHNQVQPWKTLICEENNEKEEFKGEWATIKDKKLYVGSPGYPWAPKNATDMEPKNQCGSQWIKILNNNGDVASVNWKPNYTKLMQGTKCKGYITHEAVTWSDIQRKWFFAPRKCSAKPFSAETVDTVGSNLLINCDENFNNIQVIEVGEDKPSRGFSSVKFLPHSDDTIIVALKTYEDEKSYQTFITVFGINGKIFLPDTQISKEDKYEGLEFLRK
uniref:Apyrase n=1 Tax=Cacopsylla melanoneura TaxID=428564 RepID=A0A8D9B3X9_9HEMI